MGAPNADRINGLFNDLERHMCDNCGLRGHSKGHCWLLSQVHADAKRNGTPFMCSYRIWRQSMIDAQKTERDSLTREMLELLRQRQAAFGLVAGGAITRAALNQYQDNVIQVRATHLNLPLPVVQLSAQSERMEDEGDPSEVEADGLE